MNVRSVGVGRVGVCRLCTCVNEERGDGTVSQRLGDIAIVNGPVWMCERVP